MPKAIRIKNCHRITILFFAVTLAVASVGTASAKDSSVRLEAPAAIQTGYSLTEAETFPPAKIAKAFARLPP